jgi:DNA modification methylase
MFIRHLLEVFGEVWRVLRDDGTLWLNIGDSYAGSGIGWQKDDSSSIHRKWLSEREYDRPPAYISSRQTNGIKPKDLFGVPWRLALALQHDGWYLRSDVIWEKPNSLPESAKDRPSRSHEYLFLLSKREHYFFDAEAIKEPFKPESLDRYERGGYNSMTEMPTGGRNKRTVWSICIEGFDGPHYALFPTELVKPCILASTSEKGCCPTCGKPWIRRVERTGHVNNRKPSRVPRLNGTQTSSTGWAPTYRTTNDWQPGCRCGIEQTVPCRVLDPFGGAGTTALVARQLGRNSVYIDLSQTYADLAIERLEGQALHLPLRNVL